MSADDYYEWDEPAAATSATGSPAEETELQPLAYPNLLSWVEGLLSPMYRRQIDGRATTWCPEWWNHAEALTRLEAIWRAWDTFDWTPPPASASGSDCTPTPTWPSFLTPPDHLAVARRNADIEKTIFLHCQAGARDR